MIHFSYIVRSLPQIILQFYILYGTNDAERMGLDGGEIQLSLVFAGIHSLTEIMLLKIESDAVHMHVLHYAMICLNGRLGIHISTASIDTMQLTKI